MLQLSISRRSPLHRYVTRVWSSWAEATAAENNPKSSAIPARLGLILVFIALLNSVVLRTTPAPLATHCVSRTLLHFFEPRNHGAAGPIDRTIFVDGEDQGTGQHQPKVTLGDDFVAFDFVRAVDGVGTETDVGFPVFEFGVYTSARVAILSFRAATTGGNKSCGRKEKNQKRFTQD